MRAHRRFSLELESVCCRVFAFAGRERWCSTCVVPVRSAGKLKKHWAPLKRACCRCCSSSRRSTIDCKPFIVSMKRFGVGGKKTTAVFVYTYVQTPTERFWFHLNTGLLSRVWCSVYVSWTHMEVNLTPTLLRVIRVFCPLGPEKSFSQVNRICPKCEHFFLLGM